MENSKTGANNANEGFFKYLLHFDDEQKHMIMNSMQYSIPDSVFMVLVPKS